jgi:hypothetical protein
MPIQLDKCRAVDLCLSASEQSSTRPPPSAAAMLLSHGMLLVAQTDLKEGAEHGKGHAAGHAPCCCRSSRPRWKGSACATRLTAR